jgi:hypothetical protein
MSPTTLEATLPRILSGARRAFARGSDTCRARSEPPAPGNMATLFSSAAARRLNLDTEALNAFVRHRPETRRTG